MMIDGWRVKSMGKKNVQEIIDSSMKDETVSVGNRDVDEVMDKYLSSDVNEGQQVSPLVGLIRSKINGNEPNKVIVLGNLLSLTGLSMILQDDRTRNYIQQGVKSLVGKM